MNLKDLGNALVKIVPAVGTALLGPAGGAVATVLASVFGGDKANVDDLYTKIISDPDHLIKLKQIESDQLIKLQQIALDSYKAEIDDRKSARDNETKRNDYTLEIIAFVFIIGYFAIPVLSVYKVITFSDVIFARLQDALMLILSFYFGSSRGEQKASK